MTDFLINNYLKQGAEYTDSNMIPLRSCNKVNICFKK